MKFKRLLLSVTVCAAAALPAMTAAAQDRVHLPPSSPWVADFAEDSCALRRTFENEDARFFLELRKFAPGRFAQVIVAGNSDRRRVSRVGLNFVPDSEPDWHDRLMAIEIDGFGEGALGTISPYTAELRTLAEALQEEQDAQHKWTDEQRDAREREIDGLALTSLYADDIVLQTGEMHEPMAVMRSCLDDLLGQWGINVEAHRSLMRQVKPRDMERWVRPIIRNYPSEMLRTGEQGVVRIRLNVSAEGEPTDCSVQLPMSHDTFDEEACAQLLRYAEFEPALDGNGAPIASYWTTSVIYAIN